MPDNLKAIGVAAQLSPAEQKKIDDFQKALSVHKDLLNMPADAASAKYNNLPPDQQASLKQNFGNEDPTVKPHQGWLGTAWHYTGGALGYAGSHILAGLGNVSDVMTRAYRTGAIAADQGVDLGTAWTIANDKGDKVFSPGRIDDAKIKFGSGAVGIAMRIAAGEKIADIAKSATPEEIKYLQLVDPRNTVVAGIGDEAATKAARDNFQDTLDAVNAAKYSPGRQIANLVTPASLEGSGLFYKAVSGAVDSAYRILADPLLIAGKAKRAWDVSHYALDVVIGGGKVDDYFAKPAATTFWNQYGAGIKTLTEAEKSGDVQKIIEAKNQLKTLAPEFGPAVVKSFQKAPAGGIVDANTAKAFFQNTQQVAEMAKGAAGRQRVLMPTMDTSRKLRVAAVTTGNKVFNIDRIGSRFVDNYFFGGATDADGIAKSVVNGQEQFIDKVTASTNFKGIARFSTGYIQHKIDRVKASFTLAPIFDKEVMDVTAVDASDKIYRMATMILPTKDARTFSEAFGAIEETGAKKDMYYGLWSTIAEVRGMNTTLPGQSLVRQMTGKNKAIHSISTAEDAFPEVGALPSDFNNFVSVPSLVDLDRAAARNGLTQKLIGIVNSDFASKMTSAWSFLTLAGPRYAVRNAGEDLMVNLAIGESPWGLPSKYLLSTRLNTFAAGAMKAEGTLTKSNNPLGIAMRFVNRKDVNKYSAEISNVGVKIQEGKTQIKLLQDELKAAKAAGDDVQAQVLQSTIADTQKSISGGATAQTRQIFARALTEGRINRTLAQLGKKPLSEADAAHLADQIKYGDMENALAVVSEGGMNFATGNDYITRTTNLAKQMGVRVHALEIKMPQTKYVKKAGERAFKPQAVSTQDEASLVAWLMRIGYYANDELGSIAVANLGNKVDALAKMREWTLTPKGQQFLKDSRLASSQDGETVLNLAYSRAMENFVKKDGTTLNEDLLSKIRSKDENGEWKVTGSLSLDDLPKNEFDIPAAIVGPTLIPAVEAGQYTSSLMQNGWTWLGQANARMSRQPMVLQEMVTIRKQFEKTGFDKAWIESYTRHVDPTDVKGLAAATEQAKRSLASIVEDRAVGQIQAYVDNPLIRTQLAFSSRNFARFYRATEDFYRRMYRVVRYNPEGIVKAALTYEGVTHSGWVQKDDQGQDYFVYPGIGPVYNAVQNVLDKLGIKQEFKIPFPVQFGAQLKMITPSLNPDSMIPTFSGPAAGISVTTISHLVGIFDKGAADTITGYAMGKYAVNQPVLSALLPAHINRLYAAMNTDERNSQYASAWRKAVTYLEASGHGIPVHYDKDGNVLPPSAAEQEDYRQKIKATTQTVLAMRFAFGFFAPASPAVQLKSDMAQWVSDNGTASYKQAFNDLLNKYPNNYDMAMKKWIELFPKEIPYTVTESQKSTLAIMNYAKEAGDFVTTNQDLFNKYKLSAGFLMPHKSGFSWDAYQQMKNMGLMQNKRVDDYLKEVQASADIQQYYAKKNEFDTSLAGVGTDFERTQLRKDFNQWKSVFLAGRPMVQEELSNGSQKALTRLQTLDELNQMLAAHVGVAPKTESALRDMAQVYQDYNTDKTNLEASGTNQKIIKMLKDDAIVKLKSLSSFNENTQAAYDVIFGPILGA